MATDPSQSWPGSDDQLVVNEMLNDPNSPHWEKCRNCIASYLQKLGVPAENLEDITQNATVSVYNNLKDFQFKGSLIAWIQKVAWSRKMDWLREKARYKPPNGRVDSLTDIEAEGEAKASEAVPTTEEKYLSDEIAREIKAALEDYASSHTNPERIIAILQSALYDGDRQKDIANSHHISSARVSQIIRDALRHVREKMERGPDSEPPAPPKPSP